MLFSIPQIKLTRRAKIIMGIVITLVFFTLVFLFFWSAWNNMFKQNPRFTMTRFTVISANGSGWWHGKETEVSRLLEDFDRDPEQKVILEEGKSNLFQLNLETIRKRMEQVPEIEQARIRRILPDTLEIQIVERTPAAVLGTTQSPFLADQSGVVLRRNRCLKISGILPLIYGFRGPIPSPGYEFEQIKSALEYIRLSKIAYGEIRITMINVSAPDYLAMRVFFKEDPADYYDIWLPAKDPESVMDRILTSIYEIKKLGIERRNIDLRFKNQTILRQPSQQKNQPNQPVSQTKTRQKQRGRR